MAGSTVAGSVDGFCQNATTLRVTGVQIKGEVGVTALMGTEGGVQL